MNRRRGYAALLLAGVAAVVATAIPGLPVEWVPVAGVSSQLIAQKSATAVAVVLGTYGLYAVVLGALATWTKSKRRIHDVRNVLQLVFVVAGALGVFAVLTEQWVGLLFSLGIVGFAVTFALQQPLFSLLGWAYIVLKRPYQVGDRVKIEGAKGDVIEVDFLVTTLWEVGGEDLVSGHQPSGRMVTVPNSVVLSTQVYNYSLQSFPYVWNELTIQVAYETDLEFAREQMSAVADDYLGEEMAERVDEYREALAETPVELEVRDRPSVNVAQRESWVELKLRYLVDPKAMQTTRNHLYERILERFNEHPDRVMFPVGRNR